jgi:hypothetical protein
MKKRLITIAVPILAAAFMVCTFAAASALAAAGFEGEWHRTGVAKSASVTVLISKVTKDSFDFSFTGYDGGNRGELEAKAKITKPGRAVCEYTFNKEEEESATVEFTLQGPSLNIQVIDGDPARLGFGAGVVIDGTYTRGEPAYTAEDIFGSDKTRALVKKVLGPELFEGLVTVMENGDRYESARLTYAGFIRGAGMGAYLLIDEDKIFFLGHYLESDAEKDWVFVTNDELQDVFPAEMFEDAGEIDPDDVSVTFRGVDGSATQDDSAVKGLWLEVPKFPKDAKVSGFTQNDHGVATYSRTIDDGALALIVQRLMNRWDGEDLTADKVRKVTAELMGIQEDAIDVTENEEELAELYSYPVASTTYSMGEGEDARKNLDLYLFTDNWVFRVTLSIAERGATIT